MHSPRSPRPRRRLPVWLALLALLSSCGGDDDALERARLRLERGDLQTAEATLQGLSGPAADALRERVADAREHRGHVEAALSTIRAQALEHEDVWARTMLAELRRGETDPGVLERIDQTQSDLASDLAARRRAPLKAGPPPEDEADADSTALARGTDAGAGAASAGSRGMLERAREAQRRRQWKTALALAGAAGQEPAAAAEASLAKASIASAARVEAEELLARAKATERGQGPARASAELAPELARFPVTLEFETLRLEASLLASRAARGVPAGAGRIPGPGRPGAARPGEAALARAESPEECAALAQAYAELGELGAAEDAWLEAARRSEDPGWREECGRSASECAARLALREELSDFARIDDLTARLLGRDTGGDGAPPRFESLPLADLAAAVDRARVSPKAEFGWIVEAIVRGDEAERESALARLGVRLERGRIDRGHASKLAARAKGELGEGGWTFRAGRWVEGAAAARASAVALDAELAARRAALVGELRRATFVERESVLARVRAEGDTQLLSEALEARWKEDWERIAKHPNLRQFAELADNRRELDRAREQALLLIFDEVRYFYPYNPPECPPDKAAKYPAVQREVDELVGAVREVWERPRRARMGDALAQQLADAAWLRARAEAGGVALSDPPADLRYAEHLPAGGEIGIAQFAWDAAERAALAESDRIEARNERLWAALERAKSAPDVPGHDEAEQVRVTNAYRRMLGRRALAWNPRLQAATQGHSDYMANTGDFGHFEQGDPARRTPSDRMQLAGYARGVSENCSMGRGDPKSAHEGWTQSSGHHRNLLMRDHREMASAIASSYWTQNFGLDTAFLADL